jgi:hypothetical protein
MGDVIPSYHVGGRPELEYLSDRRFEMIALPVVKLVLLLASMAIFAPNPARALR